MGAAFIRKRPTPEGGGGGKNESFGEASAFDYIIRLSHKKLLHVRENVWNLLKPFWLFFYRLGFCFYGRRSHCRGQAAPHRHSPWEGGERDGHINGGDPEFIETYIKSGGAAQWPTRYDLGRFL